MLCYAKSSSSDSDYEKLNLRFQNMLCFKKFLFIYEMSNFVSVLQDGCW